MGTVNVITASQLDRIRARVCTIAMVRVSVPAQPTHTAFFLQLHETSLDTSREDERLRLKKLSDERAHRWPNTLQVRPPPLPVHCCLLTPPGDSWSNTCPRDCRPLAPGRSVLLQSA
jgi:hypothetical protein